MKADYSRIALTRLCRLLGLSRQAYYQHFQNHEIKQASHQAVLKLVTSIRAHHPQMGGRKLFKMIQPLMQEHEIKLGRDCMFDLLRINRLLVKRRKVKQYTTNSYHSFRKYPNLIKGYTPTAINQLWVSDITYWKTNRGYVYISLITDAYSRKIVGYHVGKTLEAVETIKALKMAITSLQEKPFNLIHHSDRGFQYCSNDYVKLLRDNSIKISMTENGDPYENALAERMNGIIKGEYLYNYSIQHLMQAQTVLDSVVKLYNEERLHMSCGYKTPESVHSTMLKYG
jgi:transposase InsO family protein